MNKNNFVVNNWVIDRSSGSIQHRVTGEQKRLGVFQLKLLDILQQNAGKIFTREELTHLVWERRVIGNNSLPNAIHALRTALEDDGKQQRIIRTIPKQGYVLEAEYCQYEEKAETEPEERAALAEEERVSPPLLPPLDVPMPQEEPVRPTRFTRGKRVLIALLITLIIACIGYLAIHRNNVAVPREVAKNIYSHIRLFALLEPGTQMKEQTVVFDRLKESYDILNKEINKKALRMSIYYRSENQMLNYTLRLYNTCEQKLLIMQIDHWRSDAVLLNKLILSETRRKIDEMAPCKAY